MWLWNGFRFFAFYSPVKFAEKAIVFSTMDFHHLMIVVRTQHPQKLDAISTMGPSTMMTKIVVPNKTLAPKGKETVTMTMTA